MTRKFYTPRFSKVFFFFIKNLQLNKFVSFSVNPNKNKISKIEVLFLLGEVNLKI